MASLLATRRSAIGQFFSRPKSQSQKSLQKLTRSRFLVVSKVAPPTPTLKVKEFLVSLSKDPLTVITPELPRIVKTLPGLVSKGTKNGRNYQ